MNDSAEDQEWVAFIAHLIEHFGIIFSCRSFFLLLVREWWFLWELANQQQR